jgi:aspartate/glutamate racemase
MDADFYRERFARHGISLLAPNESTIERSSIVSSSTS